MRCRLKDALAGRTTPDDFAPGVWDSWNATTPAAQRDDGLATDAALLERPRRGHHPGRAQRLREIHGADDARLHPVRRHAARRARLPHSDLEVTRDPGVTIARQAAELVVDNLGLAARFTANPTGDTTVTAATTQAATRLHRRPDARHHHVRYRLGRRRRKSRASRRSVRPPRLRKVGSGAPASWRTQSCARSTPRGQRAGTGTRTPNRPITRQHVRRPSDVGGCRNRL
jgi:hypothetical protein